MKEYKLRTTDGRIVYVKAKSRASAVHKAQENNQCYCEIVDNLKLIKL